MAWHELNDRQKKVLKLLKNSNTKLTLREMRDQAGYKSHSEVYGCLIKLEKLGYISRYGNGEIRLIEIPPNLYEQNRFLKSENDRFRKEIEKIWVLIKNLKRS